MKELDTITRQASPAISATPANMRRFPGCLAYDRYAHASYSADAGDYWYMSADEPLKGMFGKPLILARRVSYVEPVTVDLIAERLRVYVGGER